VDSAGDETDFAFVADVVVVVAIEPVSPPLVELFEVPVFAFAEEPDVWFDEVFLLLRFSSLLPTAAVTMIRSVSPTTPQNHQRLKTTFVATDEGGGGGGRGGGSGIAVSIVRRVLGAGLDDWRQVLSIWRQI
jgi:hypothetical protein